ncbi:MAG TPA: TSUP family transporter [Bacteroidia bacterium]|jgi:siroheme synthase-like protein|nr:TSUP family transporter [Bacteroidia bacterium]
MIPVTAHGNTLFPIFLKLEGFRVLIVGGGKIGLEKIQAVLTNSPDTRVVLVAPRILPDIFVLASNYPGVELRQRSYRESDLEDIGLVITATGIREVGARIRADAGKRNLLVNVADTPDLCDFYLGSVVRKGDLKIAISTNGKSPTMAKRIKEVMNDAIPDETQEVLENLSEIRGQLKGDLEAKVKKLNAITSVMVDKKEVKPTTLSNRIRKASLYSLAVILLLLTGHLLFLMLPSFTFADIRIFVSQHFDKHLLTYIIGGFTAQMIDGSLGMAYGVSVTTFLLSLGIPAITPAVASASMHASEIFTTGSSSLVYMRYKNINKRLFRKLLLPGAIGAVLGALTISYVSKESLHFVKPLVAVYTLFLGALIVVRTIRSKAGKMKKIRHIIPVAAAGGFLDSVGGGGWGPIVTTSLIAGGRNLRYSIGSSHLVKFFVAMISTLTFITVLGLSHWQIIFGLVIGGMVAAPISIYFSNKIPIRGGLILVGSLVVLLSLRTLILTFI